MSLTALALGLLALGASPPSGGPAGDGAQASWAIGPGHERVFKTLLPAREGELEDGWALRHLGVPGDRVEAIYGPKDTPKSCERAPLCLALVHPSAAPEEAPRAGPFALVVRAAQGIATEALVAGISSRLSAAPAFDPFKRIEAKVAPPPAPNVGEVVGDGAATDPDLAARFRAFLGSDPDLAGRLTKVEVTTSRVRYHLRGDGGDVHVVELRPRSPRQSHPDEVTTSFFIQGVGPLADPPDLTARVHRAVASADDGSLRLAPEHVMSRGERSTLHWILIALSALALLALALGSRGLARAVRQTLGPGRLVWWLLGLGVVLRLVLPYRMVEMGIGYQLTRLAEELLLPRYGAGTVTLHHGVMALFGADHAVMVWTHKILGCLTLPLATAVGARLLGPLRAALPHAVPLWAGALALSPMLLRSDLTESNLVPVLLGLWAGLFAWQSLEGRARVVLTAAGLAYAGLCRPEMAVVAPGIWLLLERPWRARREAILVGVVLAVALSAQLVFVNQVVAWEIGEQSLHFSKGLSPGRLAKILANNALFDPTIVPLLTPLLALGAAVHKEGRSLALTLMGGGLLWLYVYAVDLSNASQPRLHIVALLPWSLAAALTMARLLAHHRSTGISVLALWMLTALGTVPTLWAPTNEDTQDALFDRLEEALPKEEGAVLVTLARSDAPDEAGHYTHRHLPTYLFSEVETLPIGSMVVALERAPGKVYYFQGVSCYAQLLRAARQERGILPACARVHERFTLAPIWTERVPNHGNPPHQELGYYGDDPAFDVGLWRVEGLSEDPAGAAAR
jgi:hypothetical protein